jgi:TetR/AcrR family fatty acid metabolism transcriptional regulator
VVRLHLELVQANPHMGEVITVELRQSSKFIKEYANPKFAEFLRLIAGAIVEGQRQGELRADIDPYVMARALFGALDEIALAWLVKSGGAKDKIDLPRAAEQLGILFIDGLRAR